MLCVRMTSAIEPVSSSTAHAAGTVSRMMRQEIRNGRPAATHGIALCRRSRPHDEKNATGTAVASKTTSAVSETWTPSGV